MGEHKANTNRPGKAVKATAMPDLTMRFSPELLANAITAKRTAMKLRIIDVAEALSLSRQTIIKIEKGDASVNFYNLLKVMDFLGLWFQITTDSDVLSISSEDSGHDWF